MYPLKRYIPTWILLLAVTLVIASCAQIVSPSGGPKDVTPPKVLKMIPANNSINFKAKEIDVTFDEYIQLNDLNNQLIVSPALKYKPTVKIRNKMLRIILHDTLKPNTTYTINMGNAIRDLHEDNPMENFQYTFSTGTYLDSLSISGKAENAFDHQTKKGVLVMLYPSLEDSTPYKMRPEYFTKTKKDGSYSITHIRPGKYKLFALKDNNNNYLFDQPNETIGYKDTPVDLHHNDSVNIALFQEANTNQYIKKYYTKQYGDITFIFNIPAKNISVQTLNVSGKKSWAIMDYSTTGDTVDYWYTDINVDTLKMQVSESGKVLEKISLPLISKKEALNPHNRNKFQLTVSSNVSKNRAFDLNQDILLKLSHPITEYHFSKIILTQGKDTLKPKIKTAGKANREFTIAYPWKEGSNYHLFIAPKTFRDIYGLVNDTVQTDFKTNTLNHYGTLKLMVNVPEKANYILQMLDTRGHIVKENHLDRSTMVNYEYLHPGKYLLKIIYDTNNNGKWDTGNYLKKIQPEKVAFYSTLITIRANWDMTQEWDVK